MKNIKKIKSELMQEGMRERMIGHEVIKFLNLKVDKDGFVQTSWGTKTVMGLGGSILRIVEESQ